MAEFKQRITLEGADVVLRQLQQIGATGQQSFNQLQTAVNANNTALSRISQTVNTTQQSVQRFGQSLSQLTSIVSPLSNNIGGLLSVFGAFAGPAGIAAASVGLIAFVRSAADAIVQTDRLARAFGLTNAQFRGLGRVVQEAGLSIEDLQTALTRFAGGAATEASRQIKGLVDVIKLLPQTNFRNLIRVDDVLADIQRTREAALRLAEQIKATFEETRDPRAALSIEQIARQLEQTARRADAAGAAMRRALGEALGQDLPLTQLERLDQIIVKTEAGIRSLGVSFLDARGKQVDTLTALSRFIDELAKVEPGLRRARIEATAFGRGIGVEVAEALINARRNGESLIEVLERFGVIDAPVENARQLRLAFIELDRSAAAVKNNLVAAFGPDLSLALRGAASEVLRFRSILAGNFRDAFRDASGLLQLLFRNLPAQLQGFNLARLLFNPALVQQAAEEFLNAARLAVSQFFQSLAQDLASVRTLIADVFRGLGVDVDAVFRTISSAAQTTFAFIQRVFAGNITWDEFRTAAQSAFDFVVNLFTQFPASIASAIAALPDILSAPFRTWLDVVSGIVRTIMDFIRSIGSSLRDAISSGSEGVTGGEFASGGFVRGPGTGTSDSILARFGRGMIRVSNGEFIVRADAVKELMRRYGSGIMWAINRGELPKFSLGGLVDRVNASIADLAIPRFAGGGMIDAMAIPAAASGGQVFLSFNGGKSVGPFSGSEDAIRALTKAAVSSNMFSAQRRQSSVR